MAFFTGSVVSEELLAKMVEHFAKWYAKMAEILGSEPFFGGAKPTLSDFWYFALMNSMPLNTHENPNSHVYKAMKANLCTPLEKWCERMSEELKDYLAARKVTML